MRESISLEKTKEGLETLPDVIKQTKSNKSGSIAPKNRRRKILTEDYQLQNINLESLSDEKISIALSSSEKESKEYQSSS